MRKFNKPLITVLILTVFLLMNTIGAVALGSFTDVVDDFWAKDYIENMSKEGIITGYNDATFRPLENVSKMAAVVMMYRTVKAADKLGNINVEDLVDEYSTQITINNIPDWPDHREAIAFALEKEIITSNELKTFVSAGKYTNATRIEITRYLGKILNLYLQEDLDNKFFTFGFNDIEFLKREDYPYLDLLIKKDIINSKGDYQGNFNPNDPIQRAALAKMLSMAFDILGNVEEELVVEEPASVENAIIDLIDGSKNLIRIIDEDNVKRTYMVNDNVEIIINNLDSDLDDLEEGSSIKIYIKNEKLVKIVTDDMASYEEGEVYSIIDMDSYYLVTLKNENNKKRTFKLRSTASIEIDGDSADADELEKGQVILDIEFDGEYIESIEVENGERTYEGILESQFVFGEYPKLTIKTYGQKVMEFEVDEDAEVRKNNKKRSLQSLTKGDLVTLYTEQNVVVKVIAVSIEEDDEGVIKEILISSQPQITIETDNDELITYDLDINADIEVDDEDVEIYDLRIGYRVDMEIESGTITSIQAKSVEVTNSITGIVTNVYEDNEAIIVEVNNNGKKEKLSVVAEDARIYDVDGDRISLDDIDRDDEVLVFGKNDTGIFNYIAERIYIVKKN